MHYERSVFEGQLAIEGPTHNPNLVPSSCHIQAAPGEEQWEHPTQMTFHRFQQPLTARLPFLNAKLAKGECLPSVLPLYQVS